MAKSEPQHDNAPGDSMSFSSQYNDGKQAITRQKLALAQRIRRNFALKLISLLTAIFLYFYVQQERNPMVPRQFLIPISYEGLPAGVAIDTDPQPLKVTITGPQPVIEVLKDSDIRIIADLRSLKGDHDAVEHVKLRYDVKLSSQMQSLLSYDPWPLPRQEVQVHPQRSREVAVEAHFPREARAGYHYGIPVIRPDKVNISGRADKLQRVAQIVADAKSIEDGGGIDNYFPLSARDAFNNPVDGITFDIPKAHVTVPIQEDPYSKILSVSPIIGDQPSPGYRITKVVVEPRQVRVVGRPEVIDTLSTLMTEEILANGITDDRQLSIPLVIPKGVVARDNAGDTIVRVTVQISVEKTGATSPQPPSGPSGNQP